MVTIIAVTQGEETFIDSNGNGLFDGPHEFNPSDPELDTPEPFIDHITLCNGLPLPPPCPPSSVVSGDNQFDPSDRFELFFDSNRNGTWDQPNRLWDANKPIFATTTVLFSGCGVATALGKRSVPASPCFRRPEGAAVKS